MVRLKAGQKVFLEDGSRAIIEDGDCLVEKSSVTKEDIDNYILSYLRIQTKPIFQAYEIYERWVDSLGLGKHTISMIGNDVKDIKSYESWVDRITLNFLFSVLSWPKIWSQEYRSISDQDVQIAEGKVMELIDGSYQDRLSFLLALNKERKENAEALLNTLLLN